LSKFDKVRFVRENEAHKEYLKTEPKIEPRNGNRVAAFKDP
jgi:hypothetical protein